MSDQDTGLDTGPGMSIVERRVRVALFGLLCLVSIWYTSQALGFHRLARYAPLLAGSLATILFASITIREGVRLWHESRGVEQSVGRTMEYMEEDEVTTRRLALAIRYAAWIVGYVALVWLVGMRLAAPVFVGVFMLAERRQIRPLVTVLSVLGVIGFLLLFDRVGLHWYVGRLFSL